MNTDDTDLNTGVEGGIPGVESYKPFRIIVDGRGEGWRVKRAWNRVIGTSGHWDIGKRQELNTDCPDEDQVIVKRKKADA
jgi:hypothetical protein